MTDNQEFCDNQESCKQVMKNKPKVLICSQRAHLFINAMDEFEDAGYKVSQTTINMSKSDIDTRGDIFPHIHIIGSQMPSCDRSYYDKIYQCTLVHTKSLNSKKINNPLPKEN